MNNTLFNTLKLRAGAGGDYSNGLCVMEAVSWIANEGATDRPECACPVLGTFAMSLNDCLSDENRQLLRPLIIPLTGTRSKKHEQKRAEYIALRVAREVVPLALDAAGLADHAKALRESKDLIDALAVARSARNTINGFDGDFYVVCASAANAANAIANAIRLTSIVSSANAVHFASRVVDSEQPLISSINILSDAIDLGPNGRDAFTEHFTRAKQLEEFVI